MTSATASRPAPRDDARPGPALPDAQGFFGPGSVAWRVNRQMSCLLAARRAVLLQLAHPLIAAGVAAHSSFRTGPLSRLSHTLDLSMTVMFGTREDALAAAEAVRKAHRGVHGKLDRSLGQFPSGTRYNALDPAAGAWVLATLIDSALVAYRRFAGPLNQAEQESYLSEMKRFGELLGLPATTLPPDIAAFRRWFNRRLATDVVVTPLARELGAPILRPLHSRTLVKLPWRAADPAPAHDAVADARISQLLNVVTAGLLPAVVRRGYAFKWGALERHALHAATLTLAHVIPLLPETLRIMPSARAAERRLASDGVVAATQGRER